MSISAQIVKMNQYTARVDRAHPTAFVFLIDQSGSMEEVVTVDGKSIEKQDLVANAINNLLEELLNRCTKPEEIRHYFDIALIGYGEDSDSANYIVIGDNRIDGWVSPAKLQKLARYKKETIEQNIRGVIKTREVDVPYWLEPIAKHRTPMYDAFMTANELLTSWCKEKEGEDCYPPVLINITDGLATDAYADDMISIANDIMQLGTMDGNVLIFNIHLSVLSDNSVVFPSDIKELGNDEYAQMLFNMSSSLPKTYNKEIEKMVNKTTNSKFKAMGYNQSVHFVNMLNIGTMTNMADDSE